MIDRRQEREARRSFSVHDGLQHETQRSTLPSGTRRDSVVGGAQHSRRGMGFPGAVAVAATAVFYGLLVQTRAPCGVDGSFCSASDGVACARLRAHLAKNLHGQTAAVNLLADALCDHLETPHPSKPLVAALHGPPGVGKSYFHRLLAQAVYGATTLEEAAKPSRVDEDEDARGNREGRGTRADRLFSFLGDIPAYLHRTFARGETARRARLAGDEDARLCPGPDCPAYKIVFGADYVETERADQSRRLRDAVLSHLRDHPESVVVIEEYDKMGCAARGVVRQLLERGEHPEEGGGSFKKSVFVLEANAGFTTIKKTLDEELDLAGDRLLGDRLLGDRLLGDSGSVSETFSEPALLRTARFLRDLMFTRWTDEDCETSVDTKRTIGNVDVFAPFVPMTESSLREVVRNHLDARAIRETDAAARLGAFASLTYDDPAVVDFLAAQVEFEGRYAIEGGKEVPGVLSRFLTRALRRLAARAADAPSAAGAGSRGVLAGKRVRVSVAVGGRARDLEARIVSSASDEDAVSRPGLIAF